MDMEVKNSVKPVDYREAMKVLEKRVKDVHEGKKSELLDGPGIVYGGDTTIYANQAITRSKLLIHLPA